MNQLLAAMEDEIGSLALIPSDGGRFEVTVDGVLVYSKLKTGRHAEPGEVMDAIRALQRG